MKRVRLILGAVVLAIVGVAALLYLTGIWQFNRPALPVKGVDVSHFQGQIDWPTLAADGGLSFAFVKATEGSGTRDEAFEANWAGARAAGLRTGAYHFFSYDTPGSSQTANFIATVPVESDALPPVIDVEFYGAYYRTPLPPDEVVPELEAMANALREHYGVRPILYVTSKSYSMYVRDRFIDCDIWFRNVISKPSLSDRRDWAFWQYADRARLKGYAGPERFIDLDAFNGDAAAFDRYPER
ncbi:MAG: glycoside hydrolase family 25 [Clostridia bacterium]|nr:glycoside hydrolase family 25 [Clostridia bacterium]